MASLAISSSGVSVSPALYKAVSGKFDNFRVGFVSGKDNMFTRKRRSTIVSVATQPPPGVVANPRPGKDVTGESKKLAAWTSVKQERWEGELNVEGELPLWLVCQSLFCKYICIIHQLLYFLKLYAIQPLSLK